MSYVSKNLMPGEELVFQPRYHWIRFFPAAFGIPLGVGVAIAGFVMAQSVPKAGYTGAISQPILLIVGGVIVLVSLIAMGWRWLADSFDEFAVTSLRVFLKTGVLARSVRQIPLDKVQDVNVRSTMGGRWLAYGDVEIQTAGADGTVIFPRILHPEEFRNVLFAHSRQGLAVAAPAVAAAVAAGHPVAGSRVSVEERLKEAERLFKKGSISEAEYQEKRQALIREL